MKPVTSRVLRRWFFNNKGYRTKQDAYKAKAKMLLVEMVLGPWVERCSPDGETSWMELENAPPHTTIEERRQLVDERFAMFFPHDGEPDCQKACYQQTIKVDYSCGYPRVTAADYRFQSCKAAQKRWIDAKVKELIADDEKVEANP